MMKMSSDNEVLMCTANNRLKEFLDLGYPLKLLQHLCAKMARDTGNLTFRKIGDLLYMTHYRPKAGTEERTGDNQTYTIDTVQNRDGNTSG